MAGKKALENCKNILANRNYYRNEKEICTKTSNYLKLLKRTLNYFKQEIELSTYGIKNYQSRLIGLFSNQRALNYSSCMLKIGLTS